MITLNGKQYHVKFTRVPEPVTFYVKGKVRQRNSMATYCELIGEDDPTPFVRGRVTQSHKDVYNRRKATEAAFADMLTQLEPAERAEAARQFFAPPPAKQKQGTV